MATQGDSAIDALEHKAETAAEISENITESVVEAASEAIEAAEQRAEIAEELAEQIVDSARNSAIAQEARQGDEALWNSLNDAADRLRTVETMLENQASLLTELQSQLLSMKQPEPVILETLETSSTPPTSDPVTEALTDPAALSLESGAVENPAPALVRKRRLL